MAPRLSIVISQAPSNNANVAEIEQQIVTKLMFEPGLDAMLIGHLNAIAVSTTDHLCLEGIRGDFALLGWQPAQEAYEQLARLGIYARPGKTPFPAHQTSGEDITQAVSEESLPTFPVPATPHETPSASSLPIAEQLKRRIYFIDLRHVPSLHAGKESQYFLDILKRILQDRQTIAVPIKLAGKPSSTSTASPLSTISDKQAEEKKDKPSLQVITRPKEPAETQHQSPTHSPVVPSRAEAHASTTPASNDSDDPAWKQLDKLLDDFDSLDI
ncbi:MAG: hypothetical protein RLY14_3297 [Planctomycetota bacterium]|jgi:hypothetical protein